MMKIKFLTVSLLFWHFLILPSQANCDQDCNYGSRGDRYEGIINTPISGSIDIVSLSTRGTSSFGKTLTVKVPAINEQPPAIIVRAIKERYRLDRFIPTRNSDFYSFTYSTDYLKRIKVGLDSLRAIASTNGIYVPVLIDSPGKNYEIVFYAQSPTKFRNFVIRRDRKIFYKESRNAAARREIRFTWNGRDQNGAKATAGQYEIEYQIEIEQYGVKQEPVRRTIAFQHNPDWLR